MLGCKKKYDLIFSLGEACSCTQALRKCHLQIFSYPFDWLSGSSFEGRVEILCSKFKDFLNLADLEYSYSERSISCSAYYNKSNCLTFNHDFLINLSLEDSYPKVKEKYDRRIRRLLNNMDSANSILIVYIEIPTQNQHKVDNSVLLNCYKKIADSFPDKNIDILYIKNIVGSDLKKDFISENITILTADYKLFDEKIDYAVKQDKLKKILKNYKLNLPIKYLIKKKLQKVLINLIPTKSNRTLMRKKYHV